MTCEIVASLIDFIFEKNMFVCSDFLFCLNCKFDVYSNVVEIKDCLNIIFSDFIKKCIYLKHSNVTPAFIRNDLQMKICVKSCKT